MSSLTTDHANLPDGTLVAIRYPSSPAHDRIVVVRGGVLFGPSDFKQRHPHQWGNVHSDHYLSLRVIDLPPTAPDPTPDQEVPRDEWGDIAVGSRVCIVEINGDEHTVTIRDAESDQWLWTTDHGYDPRKVARVYLLDAPTPPDPDAELVAAIEKSVPIGSWDGREVLRRLRAEGFDVTHEATR